MRIIESAKSKAVSAAVMKGYDMLRRDFDGSLPKIRRMMNGFAGEGDAGSENDLRLFNMVCDHLETPGDNWRALALRIRDEVDPEVACAFIHYSDSNIREKTLLECYQSPLFKAYRERQPFNANMMRPCPLLDNPGMLSEMVREAGARSTDYTAPDPAEDAEARCADVAERWAEASIPLWELSPKKALSDACVAEGKSPTAWVKN